MYIIYGISSEMFIHLSRWKKMEISPQKTLTILFCETTTRRQIPGALSREFFTSHVNR